MKPAPSWFTLVLATVGAILGILSAVRQFLDGRVRLRIRCYPFTVIRPPSADLEEFVCVEVANAGSFPVTIKEVRFASISNPKGRRIDHRKRDVRGQSLPLRVAAHDSIQVLFPNLDYMINHVIKDSSRAVVETACGKSRSISLSKWHRTGREFDRLIRAGQANPAGQEPSP